MSDEAPATLELSVSEFAQRLTRYIDRAKELKAISIRGEISGWSPSANGVYFKLKDASAVIDCYAFASNAKRFGAIADGDAAVATGSIEIRPTRSGYQLLVRELRATGTGALFAEYQALRERFEREGLFAEERKRPVPRFIRSVALVSAKGLGAEDFMTKLRQNAPFVAITFVETRVQGDGAQIDIAEALDKASRLPVDAIVLTRGGGSFEDLFPFNMEPVIRAIVRASHPVITAVAHTRNRHLADFVSDRAAETPTAAAQTITTLWQTGIDLAKSLESKMEYLIVDRVMVRATQRSDDAAKLLHRAWDRQLAVKRERVNALQRRIDAQGPVRKLTDQATRFASALGRMTAAVNATMLRVGQRSSESTKRLDRAVATVLADRSRRVERAQGVLNAVDPLAPLGRGYAIVTVDRIAVRDAAKLAAGQMASVTFARGTAEVRVESTKNDG